MIAMWLQALQLSVLLAIALESPAPSPALLDVAVRSCSDAALRPCGLVSELPLTDAAPEAIVASARWDPEWLSARLELRSLRDGRLLVVREIEFAAADALDERFRALGLIIASYVPPPLPVEPPAPPAAPPDVPPRTTPPRLPRGLDLALFGGPGLDRGRPRAGLMVRGWSHLPALPLSLFLSGRAAYRPEQPRVTWITATTGMALHLVPRPRVLSLEARLELVAQRTQVRAEDGATGERARTGTFRFGTQLGAELAGRVGSSVWLFGGADLGLFWPLVRIRARGEEVGAESRLGWSLLGGARLFL